MALYLFNAIWEMWVNECNMEWSEFIAAVELAGDIQCGRETRAGIFSFTIPHPEYLSIDDDRFLPFWGAL